VCDDYEGEAAFRHTYDHPVPKSRTEAFSDGVFAIAITLLIIEVRPPHSGAGDLAGDLANQWPSYSAYVVSFAIIGIIWVNHHDIFERIVTVDRPLLFLNLLLLLTVAFLPFPTALLGEYIRKGDNAHIAAAVYSANMTLIGLAFLAIWTYLARVPSLLAPDVGTEGALRARRAAAIGPVAYGFSIPLAFVSPVACLIVYAVIALYFAITFAIARPGSEVTDNR
jgi:TMEM175 potassium channel family protein